MIRSRFIWIFLLIAVTLCLLVCCGGKKEVKDEVFDSEKQMIKAEKLVSDKDFEAARKILLEVKNRDTTKKNAPFAQMKIADSYIKEGEPDLAVEEYRKFLDLYPDNQYSSYAQYQIAMAYYSQIDTPDRGSGIAKKALYEFIKLKEMYPRNPYREYVELRIEKCRNIIADGEFMVGEFYYKKESYNAAINRLEGLLKQFPDYKRTDETLLLIGKSYKELKMADKAKEAFRILIERYPSSRFVREAKKGLL
jgi:outer membrane protein assembly factor BamD